MDTDDENENAADTPAVLPPHDNLGSLAAQVVGIAEALLAVAVAALAS